MILTDDIAGPTYSDPTSGRRVRGSGSRASLAWVLAILPVLIAVSCAAPARNAVPRELASKAQIPGLSDVRDWGDRFSSVLQRGLVQSIHQARAVNPRGGGDEDGSLSVLALSGGGANGAFGAGFLCGWSAAGARPTFKLVTGISTGALLAPFAFLGPEYDETLRTAFTTISTKDIYRERSLLEILLNSEYLADTRPLARMIARLVDEKVFTAVAEAHQQGRRLLVGTTNFDAGKLVIWDMGAIATSGRPGALELFRKVMLASAALPIAFPPVHFEVEADGRRYEETHVDGGLVTQVFFYGCTLDLPAAARETGLSGGGPVRLYVVRNGHLTNSWRLTPRGMLPITDRTINSFLGAQAIGDLYRIYVFAKRDGIEFNYACIPDDYVPAATESFDRTEMNRLFDLGFESARAGYVWHKLPPGYVDTP
jgi:predicted acylesterase/phospholipase RssA